ncbi:MAG: regulatory protein GemA [Kluyvera sp.]|uniref:regulatory protein GemA n=1 Tax=Kluyvera sp. TaxID=1538228 RepID=UPI003A861DBA
MQLNNRNAYYGLIHKGFASRAASEAGRPLTKDELDTLYRSWLEQRTGQRSCKTLTYVQLQHLLGELKAGNWIKDRTEYRPGGGGDDRPTDAQWRKLAALTKVMGWQGGLNAHELQSFVQRTTQLQGTRFLTRPQVSRVITGLQRWINGGNHGKN